MKRGCHFPMSRQCSPKRAQLISSFTPPFGEPAHGLVKPVLDLLSRPFSTDEAVFVKPKNHANMLIPALLDARRDAKVILMTSELETFLGSIISGGLLGGGGAETSILS
jgi:hypothetical protein